MARAWVNTLVVGVVCVLGYAGCDSDSTSLGGETNWLATCTTDSQCTGGMNCLCGICTKACTDDGACRAPEIRCVHAGSSAYGAACAAELEPGICLGVCSASGCVGTATCVDGFCVRPPTRVPGTGGGSNDDGGTGGSGGSHAGSGGGGLVDAAAGAAGFRDAATDQDAAVRHSGAGDGSLFIGDGSCGATTAWPPSPTVGDPNCTPNCDASSCGSLCPTKPDGITGMPCSTGCCASNVARVTVVPNPGSTQSGSAAWTTVAVGPTGTLYFGMAGGENGTPAPFSYAATTDSSGRSWPEQGSPDTSIAADAGTLAGTESPQFAFGKIAGTDAAFAAYVAKLASGSAVGRFGVQVGGSWTFENLPTARGVLATDSSGTPLLLAGDHILRRTAPNDWTSICLPDAAAGDGIALVTDSDGAWYVARTGSDHVVRVSRRDARGAWTTEAVTTGTPPAFASAIAVGAGTVHVAYTIGVATDAAVEGGGDLYYARRFGTSWVTHAVAIAADLPKSSPTERTVSIEPSYLAVDACGSPHFGLYTRGTTTFDAYYYRWTPAGFRGARFQNGCDAVLSGGIALSSSDALLGFWSCAFEIGAIPRQ